MPVTCAQEMTAMQMHWRHMVEIHQALHVDLANARRRDQLREAERERRAAQSCVASRRFPAVTLTAVRRRLGQVGRVAWQRSHFAADVAPPSAAHTSWPRAKPSVWATVILR